MNTRIHPAIASGLLAILLTGCAVGPIYERPAIETPAAFKEASLTAAERQRWKEAQPADELSRGRWWAIFKDPALDALQEQAMQANQNLQAAAARVKQARAMQSGARAGRWPELTAGLGASRQRTSEAIQGAADAGDSATLWRAQTGLSYEVDLFGRVSSETDAASADAQRAQALYQSVLLALQADVAQTYFLARQLDAETLLYDRAISLRRQSLDLVETRFHEGGISELDVARARSELAVAHAVALDIERQRAAAEHGLALLLGQPPADFSLPQQSLSRVPVAIPAGLPSALLERRPDIAAAERALAAANARIGAAQAVLFPQLFLTGTFGLESSDLDDLLRWSSRSFLLGPLVGTALSLPIFDGGRRQAGVDRARARYEEAVALYRQSVLKAFGEVEDGLSALRLLGEQTTAQDIAVASAARAAELSKMQYEAGSISYLEVIDADRSVLQRQRAVVQLDGLRAHAAVQLIRAVGGGWEDL
ncbi:efflux transporter outer membrane subunit [Castellaniella sp.]|uniref:efflux transporter outer membrane subunit n=1 Tax=Castellaniella sp. TaxID=1955812 RepID=UPI002AFFC7B4|nr:efflux transporter outer membrane subunit [Castellaniella sp.]